MSTTFLIALLLWIFPGAKIQCSSYQLWFFYPQFVWWYLSLHQLISRVVNKTEICVTNSKHHLIRGAKKQENIHHPNQRTLTFCELKPLPSMIVCDGTEQWNADGFITCCSPVGFVSAGGPTVSAAFVVWKWTSSTGRRCFLPSRPLWVTVRWILSTSVTWREHKQPLLCTRRVWGQLCSFVCVFSPVLLSRFKKNLVII